MIGVNKYYNAIKMQVSTYAIKLDRFCTLAYSILTPHVQFSWIFFCFAYVKVSLEAISGVDYNWRVQVEYCLLPVSLLFVWGSGKSDLFAPVAEITIEPAHETVNHSIYFNV